MNLIFGWVSFFFSFVILANWATIQNESLYIFSAVIAVACGVLNVIVFVVEFNGQSTEVKSK